MVGKIGIALTKCYFCGEDKEIIMNTRLTEYFANKVEEYHGKVIDKEPCNKCKELMKQGVMLISVRDNDPEYRTGNIAVVKDSAIKDIFNTESANAAIKSRCAFVSDEVWKLLGLPMGDNNE